MLPFLKQNAYIRSSSLSPLRLRSFIINSSSYRFGSTATSQVQEPSPESSFAVQYLITSCGLPSDRAIQASRYLPHLKSPHKPDSVLRFLKEAGITQPHIKAAALKSPRFLTWSVDKCWKPRMAALKEIGFSPSHISLLLSLSPTVFALTKLHQHICFWMPIAASVDKLLHFVKRNSFFLTTSIQSSAIPNLSFLQQQCRLSVRQIARLITSANRLVTSSPASFHSIVRRAEDLGIPRSSGSTFVDALGIVSGFKQSTIDAKLLYLGSLGFSPDELTFIIRRAPTVLALSESTIGCKMEFLINEAACDKSLVAQTPILLKYSLAKRLIPRNLVRKLLESKGVPVITLASFMNMGEDRFFEKLVLPYEHAIPGLDQAYRDACAGNASALKILQKAYS